MYQYMLQLLYLKKKKKTGVSKTRVKSKRWFICLELLNSTFINCHRNPMKHKKNILLKFYEKFYFTFLEYEMFYRENVINQKNIFSLIKC